MNDIQLFRTAYVRDEGILRTFMIGDPPRPGSPEAAALVGRAERAFALRVAGEVRAVSIRRDIARNLNFYHQFSGSTEGLNPLSNWPAAEALAKLGSHAYPALYPRLAGPCSELDLALCTQIVLQIDGRELGLCRLKIKQSEIKNGEISLLPKHLARLIEILEDEDAPGEKYSPNVIYHAGQTNPKLLQPDQMME